MTCVHHWILEPDKHDANGKCSLCGIERFHKGDHILDDMFGGPVNSRGTRGSRKQSQLRGAAAGARATRELWAEDAA